MRTACKAQPSGMSHTGSLRLQAVPVQIAASNCVSVYVCAHVCVHVHPPLCAFCPSELILIAACDSIIPVHSDTLPVLHLTVVTHIGNPGQRFYPWSENQYSFSSLLSLFSNPVSHTIYSINLMDSSTIP